MNIKKSTSLNAISTLMIASLFSVSAAAAPLLLEGPIESIVPNGDGATMVVMGVEVNVPRLTNLADTLIHSPTTVLTMGQLLDTTPLPGRTTLDANFNIVPLPGFVGGTAIITGDSFPGVDADGNLVTINTAAEVFVDPAENIIGGMVSANSCASADCSEGIFISGVPLVRLDGSLESATGEGRIHAPAGIYATNAIGLPVNVSTVLPASAGLESAAAAEGYLGADGKFYYWLLEAEGELAQPLAGRGVTPPPIVSITRAQCRNDKDLRIDGGISVDTGEVEIYLHNDETLADNAIAFATAAIVPDINGQGIYLFRSDVSGDCAANVTVKFKYDTDTTGTDLYATTNTGLEIR
jgi:hypothetical protein